MENKKNRIPHILIVGYYGFNNLGDEAILTCILKGLREFRPDLNITVVTGNTEWTSKTYAVNSVSSHDIAGINNAVRDADLVILGGGGIFHDYWGFDPDALLTSRHHGIPFFSGPALLSALYGKPLMLYSVGVGPLLSESGRTYTRAVFDMAALSTVRDFESKSVLESIGSDTSRVYITADPAFLTDVANEKRVKDIFKQEKCPEDKPVLGVSVRQWDIDISSEYWESQVAQSLDNFLENNNGSILFIPFHRLKGQKENDEVVINRIRDIMRHSSKTRMLQGLYSPEEIAGIFACCDLVLGMRLHSVILSIVGAVPVIALGYDPKVISLMKRIGCEDYVIDMTNITADKINNLIAKVFNSKESLSKKIKEKGLQFRELAEQDVKRAIDLLIKAPTPSFTVNKNILPVFKHLINGHTRIENIVKQKEQELFHYKVKFDEVESRLNAVLTSKTWRIGQLYSRTLGVSSLLRTKLKPGIKKLLKKAESPVSSIAAFISKNKSVEITPDALAGSKYDVFFFPMIDFSFRFQRPQQLASYFARKGHRVFYINTSEFLSPETNRKFRIREIKSNLYEVFLESPSSLDIYGTKMSEYILSYIYSSLDLLRKQYGLTTVTGIVHNPFWSPLAFKMKEDHGWKIVYDCLDDWNSDMFQGIGQPLIEEEKKLVKKADLMTVTAKLLFKKWHAVNNTCTLVRNACDHEHFVKASANPLLKNIKRPIIGFFGGIADWIDIDMIRYAATNREDWSFVLLGGVFTDVSSIEKLKNVHLPGNQPYKNMPAYLFNFDVCLIPFRKNAVTEAVDPVKLYEYFSLGKPVVARDLYEIRLYRDYLYLFNTQEEFVKCIEMALNEQDHKVIEDRKAVAASNTWVDRVNHIDNKIKNLYGKISVIIVTYNNIELTGLCIESILSKTDYPNYEIIIVDNNSTDGTPDYLKSLDKKYDLIKVILNDKNEGFAKANNLGIKASTGDYIIFLNNDTVVTKGWLTKFINYLDQYREIGLIGPVTNFCGNEAKIDSSYKDLKDMDLFAYNFTLNNEGKFFDIKMLALFCAAVRREIIEKVGLIDEQFGIGMFEDDDYSHRVKLMGYKVVCAEDIFIHHFGQGAFKKLIKTGEYQIIFKRNQKLYEDKWGIKWEGHTYRTSEKISNTINNQLKKTKDHWGKEAGTWQIGRGINWLEHEEVQKRINEKVSGDPNVNPIQYLVKFMAGKGFRLPVERCLTLGCGTGNLERELSLHNFCLKHDAYDIADKAIEKAILAAKEQNLMHIDYEIKNINEIHLPANTYDVIFATGAAHHFERLEHIFNEVNKALKTDGLFFLNEYVGPSRFQWTDRQLEVINAVLKILPRKYKSIVTNPSWYKEVYNRPTVKEVTSVDPTEAIRSVEIIPLLNEYFDIVEIKHLGGSILHSLLSNITGNFKTDSTVDMLCLKTIFKLEDVLIENGDLISDFSIIIAKKHAT